MRSLLLVFSAAAFLTGCGFENPLTSGPSANLNTWLLGVWETEDGQGNTLKMTVLPKSVNRYWLNLSRIAPNGRSKGEYRFEGYISRVGSSKFLTLQTLEASNELTPGQYVFAHYQLLDQNHIRTRIPQLSDPTATSFRLRVAVRRALKERTLYVDNGLDWTRTSEVYWSGIDENQPPQTLRFPEPKRKPAEELEREQEYTAE